MEYENEFLLPGKAEGVLQRTERVHLMRERGELRAELVDKSSCAHTDYLEIPRDSDTNTEG